MDEKFPAWAKQVVLFCHVTSRVPGDPHPDLLQEKGGRGFPHLVFMDAEGNVVGAPEGRSVESFEKAVGKVQAMIALRKKAAGGDKAAGFDLLLAEMEMGTAQDDEVEERLQALGELSRDQQAKLSPFLANREVRSALKGLTQQDKEGQLKAGATFAGMKKAGRIPTGDQETMTFYGLIMDYAESRSDPALFEDALAPMRKMLAGNPRAKAFLDAREAKLKEIRAAGTDGAGKQEPSEE